MNLLINKHFNIKNQVMKKEKKKFWKERVILNLWKILILQIIIIYPKITISFKAINKITIIKQWKFLVLIKLIFIITLFNKTWI